MRRDKVATRVLLILSVVHVAAAAPAIIRQRSLEVTKNVTPALEKRANLDDESSHHFPRMDNNLPSTSATLPSPDDTSQAPDDPQLHGDSAPELGTPQSHIDHIPTSETGRPQLQDDVPPTPGAPPSQDNPTPGSGTPQLHNDHPSTPGAPPLQDDTVPGSGTPHSQDETSPDSGPPQLHIDQQPAPGGPPSQEDPLPAYGTPQLHNDQPSTPGAPPSPDDTLPGLGTLQPQDEPSPASGDPQLHSGPPPELGTSQLRIDAPSTSGAPQLQDDMPGTPPPEDDMSESSATRTLQYEPPKGPLFEDDAWRAFIQAALRGESSYEGSPAETPASGTPRLPDGDSWYRVVNLRVIPGRPLPPDFDSVTPLHLDAPLPLDLEAPLPLDSEAPLPLDSEAPLPLDSEALLPLDSEVPRPLDSETPPPLHSETPPPLDSEVPSPLDSEAPSPLDSETLHPLESEALPSAPETHTLFNDAVRQKLKTYGVFVAVAGVSVGLAFGVKKLINDHSHGSQRAGRDLASSGVVSRGASMHRRLPKNPVLRAPAKLRDEELRLLSILTRRALERLD